MAREKKVVDASVILKLFLHEDFSEKSLFLCQEHIEEKSVLVVPSFLFIEIVNVMRYKTKQKEEIFKLLDFLYDLQLHVEPVDDVLLKKALNIAYLYDLSIYDSVYAALAQLLQCPLITADKKLGSVDGAVLLKNI